MTDLDRLSPFAAMENMNMDTVSVPRDLLEDIAEAGEVSVGHINKINRLLARSRAFPCSPRERDLARALKTALGHVDHMSAWIEKKNAGYSFEALCEDMPEIRDILEGKIHG